MITRPAYPTQAVQGLIQEREARLAVLDQALAKGISDAESGRTKPAEEVFARLETKYQAMGRPAE